jgi:ELWxxDGT repeat protein
MAACTAARRGCRATARQWARATCDALEPRRHLTVTAGAVLPVGESSSSTAQPFDTAGPQAAVVGDDVYFAQSDSSFGYEALWIRDGATRETRRVSSFGGLGRFTPVVNTLFFTEGDVLWKTGGTSAGTTQLTSSWGEPVVQLAGGDGVAYFTTSSGLWRSNGTELGTTRVVSASSPRDLTVVDGLAYFLSNGLWRYDGATAGTTRLNTASGVNADGLLAAASDGTIYFAASGGLYASDGTAGGTRLVSSVPQNPRDLEAVGNVVYFRASDSTRGEELWRSDGTAVGTGPITDLRPGTNSSSPRQLTAVGERLYFVATGTIGGASTGAELWSSDGTETGTVLVKDIVPGSGASNIGDLTAVGDQLYFTAIEPATGREMWRTDGTEDGTVRMHDLYAGAAGSSPRQFLAHGDDLLFQAVHGVHGHGLFSQRLAAVPGDPPTHLGDMVAGTFNPNFYGGVTPDGRLYFAAGDGSSTGRELFATDGTIANVAPVADVFPGPTGSEPSGITPVGNAVIFAAEGDRVGRELFKSDGTTAGTGLVKNIWSNSSSFDTADSSPRFLKNVGGTLYFFARQDNTAAEPMWRSDGTAAGTVVHAATGFSPIVVFNGQPLTGLPVTTSERNLAVIGGFVYYSGSTSTGTFPPADEELWRSNGATSTRILDIAPGNASSRPSGFTAVGSRVFFTAEDDIHGRELWVTDGTTAGTTMVKDILPPELDSPWGRLGSRPSALANVNGRLVFSAWDGTNGIELWVSDGTAAGTRMLADINPGSASATGNAALVIGKRLYFTADDGVSGQELWTTDGTPAGTYQVADLNPGPGSSNPRNFRDVNGVLMFTANDGAAGVRLYTAELPPPPVASPPGKPDLQPASDTGASDADNVTRQNNSAAGRALQFLVQNTTPGATVTIYADGVAIGTAVAEGTSTLVTTDGATHLADGVRSITARQTEPEGVESASSDPLDITVDTAIPTVDILDVTPDPRSTGVSSISIRFSRAVTGFDLADLSLTRDGGPNLLTASERITSSSFEPNRFSLSGLTSITSVPGTYRLALTAAGTGIADALAGNGLANDAEDSWVHLAPAWLAADSAATWNSATRALLVTGEATITADPGAAAPIVTASGPAAVLSISPAAGGVVNLGGLYLSDHASAAVSPDGAERVLVIGSGANFTLDATATLDLADNALVIRNASQSAALATHTSVNNLVGGAFNDFAWDRPGITSSTAEADVAAGTPSTLGILLNNDGGGSPLFYGPGTDSPTFMGAAVDANTVMVRFTRLGDGDLNGAVDTVDFALFQAGFSGVAPYVGFAFGDYDFNGIVDTVDFGLFQAGYTA